MVLQSIINGCAAGSLIAILGIGYAIITRSGVTYHFAHAAVFTIAAFVFQSLTARLTDSIVVSVALAGLASITIGLIIEWLIYRSLRIRNASRLIVLISSFGLYIVLQNIVSLGFGDASRTVTLWRVQEGWSVLGARITGLQIVTLACAVIIIYSASWWAGKSEAGRASRAIGNDSALAAIIGVNVPATLTWVMGLGSLIAGLAGVLSACDTGVNPTMGLMPFFAALVGVIVGGGSLTGTALACVAIGVLQQLIVLWTNAAWQDAIVFVVLVLVLLLRPQGLFGHPLRRTMV